MRPTSLEGGKGVLGATVAGTFTLEFARRFFHALPTFQGADLGFVRITPSCATLASSAFSRLRFVSKSCRCDDADPGL